MVLSLSTLISHADEPKNNWKDRLYYHDKKIEKMYKEFDLMYRMISEMYIKRMGYKRYERLVLTPEEEK